MRGSSSSTMQTTLTFIDLTIMTSWKAIADEMLAWRYRESDREGCIDLLDARAAKPMVPLEDARIPVLALMLELQARGFLADRSNERRLEQGGELVFSGVNAHNRRGYFQCLLRSEALFNAGLEYLPSNAPKGFYKLLLEGKIVQPGQRASVYQDQLKALQNTEAGAPATPPALPPPALPPPQPSLALADAPATDSDDEIMEAIADRPLATTTPTPKASGTSLGGAHCKRTWLVDVVDVVAAR